MYYLDKKMLIGFYAKKNVASKNEALNDKL